MAFSSVFFFFFFFLFLLLKVGSGILEKWFVN